MVGVKKPNFKIFVSKNEILIYIDDSIKVFILNNLIQKRKKEINSVEKKQFGSRFQSPKNPTWGFNSSFRWDKENPNLIRISIPLKKLDEEDETVIKSVSASLSVLLPAIEEYCKPSDNNNNLLSILYFDYKTERKRKMLKDEGHKETETGKYNFRVKIHPKFCKWITEQSGTQAGKSLIGLIEHSKQKHIESKIFSIVGDNVGKMYKMYLGDLKPTRMSTRYVWSLDKELYIHCPDESLYLEPEIERASPDPETPYYLTSSGTKSAKEQILLFFSLLTICSYAYMDLNN